MSDWRYVPAGEQAFYIYLGDRVSVEVSQKIIMLSERIMSVPGVVDVVPGYVSLLVIHEGSSNKIKKGIEEITLSGFVRGETVEVPVCYGGEFGPDLLDVARINGLSPEEVIAIHSGREYYVHFLGFAPGFPYLGGLDERLVTERLAIPRESVAAGSVGIGGAQTGIYTMKTPGGWRIIGRTPLVLFDINREEPFLFKAGDTLRFKPISPEEYVRLEGLG